MNRRQFVAQGTLSAGWVLAGSRPSAAAARDSAAGFSTDDAGLLRLYQSALDALRANTLSLPAWPHPVLTEGSQYHGVWLESAPQEAAVYAELAPETARVLARNNHLIFFALQRQDGQLPYSVKAGGAGFGQIQMVVPIAATAWELALRWNDEELLKKAYAACSRWDLWLRRWRNTRGTGLCEGFCAYDTGMDNSPRWKGMPNTCPDGDARRCPHAPGLPRLCPDLSATVYGGRVALAAMAAALGRSGDAEQWTRDAESIRALIVERLYDPQDGAFNDLDANNRFVRVRSAATLRVLGEQVPGPALFSDVWTRQANNPRAFWAPYPFPSIALDDPAFVRPIPPDSWGGAAQALTALRAPRWMEPYRKPAELAYLMQRWIEAIRRNRGFHQQMDPLSGTFTPDSGGYSPAALVFCDFLWRLSGVRSQSSGSIEWNVRSPAVGSSNFSARIHEHNVELRYRGEQAQLIQDGRCLAHVSGVVRIVTDIHEGDLLDTVGIQEGETTVTLRLPCQSPRTFRIAANQHLNWTGHSAGA